MKSNKKQVTVSSDYLELAEAVYRDATAKCTADVFDLRDLTTVKARVEKEGLSFLTIKLPQFARDFERSLANRKIDSTLFAGFRLVQRGSIPAFLQGMISLIFNRETGEIYDEYNHPNFGELSSESSTIIESVRQICLTFKKVELECTPERVHATLASFITIEQSFDSFSAPQESMSEFQHVSFMLWSRMLREFSLSDCLPKHGPGATAEHVSGNQKYVWQRWHDRLESYFPLLDNGYHLGTPEDSEELQHVSIISEIDEQPVRVVSVPKTLKGPRTIAIEPCCMQYVQQGIRRFLYESVDANWLSAGHLNFDDQSVNQRLAMDASMTGQFATIDLSDASDRVPLELVKSMFEWHPVFLEAILACRSTRAQMPDGTVVGPLRKFASMGSALCFPIEAMYFYTICVVALLASRGLSSTLSNVYDVTRELYVYGDDIIVPTTNADVVLDYLRKYNCKVNVDKTFVSGSFRESCGIDAYRGYEVTPTYLRKPRPKNKRQASQIISWVATIRLFYKKGYWQTAQLMIDIIEQLIGDLPYVAETSECLGRFSFLGFESVGVFEESNTFRWNRDLQKPQIRAYVPRPIYRTDKLEGYGALVKCFLGLAGRPTIPEVFDLERFWTLGGGFSAVLESSLEQSALFGAVTLKRRWASAH